MLNFPLIDADATGMRIRQLREENGFTVKELETKLHVAQRAIGSRCRKLSACMPLAHCLEW